MNYIDTMRALDLLREGCDALDAFEATGSREGFHKWADHMDQFRSEAGADIGGCPLDRTKATRDDFWRTTTVPGRTLEQ